MPDQSGQTSSVKHGRGPQGAALPPEDQGFDVVKMAAGLISGAIVITALYVGQDILIPLAIAFLISFALGPLVSWLIRAGVNRVLAISVVMAAVFAVIAGLGLIIVTQVQTLASDLPKYQSTIEQKLENISMPGFLERGLLAVESLQKEVTEAVSSDEEGPPARVEVIPPASSSLEMAVSWLTPVLTGLATTGIVLVFVFLVLLDRGDLRDRLLRLLGGNLHRSTDTLEEAGSRISRYLLMQVVVNVSYGVPLALGLWLIGVPGWILWGVLGAVMRFIPYLGPLLSAVFPLSLALAVDPGWEMLIWTVALIALLELVSNNIVEPLLYGSSTGLSAISLIAAATFWTALWGPVGLILSTPLTVCLLVIGKHLPQLQFLDALLGSTPVLDVPTRIYQRLLADDATEAIEIAEEEIEATSVAQFYNGPAIEILHLVSDDYLRTSRAAHRLRIANGMDELLDEIRSEHPIPNAPPRVACVGGKWEIDGVASEILAHNLSLAGIPAIQPRAGVVTARELPKLDLTGIEYLCLSLFTATPEVTIRNFHRKLRHLHPNIKLMIVLFNPSTDILRAESYEALGAVAAVTSISEATLRLQRILNPEAILAAQQAPAPQNDIARVDALLATSVLSGSGREDLDAMAKRAADVFNVKFAVISAINADTEYIVGQSMELPGERNEHDMITMPRSDAICDHVVSEGETLVVDDTDRDPVFADHPAIKLWSTRFYAGAPLKTADGLVLGALCLLDTVPRELEPDEIELLETLAADVVELITGEEGIVGQSEGKNDSASSSVGQIIPH